MDTRKLIDDMKKLLLEYGYENVSNALECADTELTVAKEVEEELAYNYCAPVPEPMEDILDEPPF